MPFGDVLLVFQWWMATLVVGAAAIPITKRVFRGWWDDGYVFAKAIGLAFVTYLVWVGGSIHVLPFTRPIVIMAVLAIFLAGVLIEKVFGQVPTANSRKSIATYAGLEALFFGALVFWSYIKAHEPSIHGLEKFMDYGFMQSALNSRFFPPADMWYQGGTINYYYFGHVTSALLSRLSGIPLEYGFNLMLATLFAYTVSISFSIGYGLQKMAHSLTLMHSGSKKSPLPHQHRIHEPPDHRFSVRAIAGGLITAFLVSLAGNMQTVYAFTKGYTGEDVVPFWTVFWPLSEVLQKLPVGMQTYWYANATRFIPFSIHEFPSYSFVVSDIHGHVLSLPFTLVFIAFLIHIFHMRFNSIPHNVGSGANRAGESMSHGVNSPVTYLYELWPLIFAGVFSGILLMTNALDGPIYFGLFVFLTVASRPAYTVFQKLLHPISSVSRSVSIGLAVGVSAIALVVTILPFLSHFSSFVSGIAVNCPPQFLENSKVGPVIFETVDKCQKSPFWMLYLLWGFFWFNGLILIGSIVSVRIIQATDGGKITAAMEIIRERRPIHTVLALLFVFSVGLIVFPEFFYFKDIYPAHFRSNTMFKLGYQAFLMYAIISAYVIVTIVSERWGTKWKRGVFLLLLVPQLFLVSIYPYFSVRSYFGELRSYVGLDGLSWLRDQYPDDYDVVLWFRSEVAGQQRDAVVLEADGDSYTDYNRISAFTGIPTVIGWAVHEWLWRGSYDVVAPRREDVRLIYEEADADTTRSLLRRYGVTHIVIGGIEREKYPNMDVGKLESLGKAVFSRPTLTVVEVRDELP